MKNRGKIYIYVYKHIYIYRYPHLYSVVSFLAHLCFASLSTFLRRAASCLLPLILLLL